MLGRISRWHWSQETIVFLIAIALFCAFSVFLDGFIRPGNLLTLVRSVSILGILGIGMAFTVIGRGIDLAIVAIYAMSAAWMLHLAGGGVPIPLALLIGYLFALSAGILNGLLIAYVEIPALFATLGMASFVYGFARLALVPLYVVYMPASASGIAWIGGGFVAGLPTPILFFAVVALLGFAILRFSTPGRLIYAMGDNFAAARNVIIVHNPDVNSYAKLLKRAEAEGIHVIQVNMRSNYNSDVYVGADWIGIGEAETQAVVDRCGPGTSQKVAVLEGQPTSGSDSGMMKGAENVLAKHPEIKLVANQAGEWDATKAHSIISTVIQQNPDLCGIVGFWDVMDLGAAAAIKESGKPIALVTSGGGEQMACDNVESGAFQEEIAYPVLQQGQDLTDMVNVVLESGLPAGKEKIVIYTPPLKITKETLRPGLCWSAKALKN